jgi:hypothetical protein
MNTHFYFLRPDRWLRLEGLVALAVCAAVYGVTFPGSWGMFAALFLLPDVSLLGYLGRNGGMAKSLAAGFYNAMHNEAFPLLLALAGWRAGIGGVEQIGLIWLAHVAFDRMVGYGLKYPESFKFTHIQRSARIGDGFSGSVRTGGR